MQARGEKETLLVMQAGGEIKRFGFCPFTTWLEWIRGCSLMWEVMAVIGVAARMKPKGGKEVWNTNEGWKTNERGDNKQVKDRDDIKMDCYETNTSDTMYCQEYGEWRHAEGSNDVVRMITRCTNNIRIEHRH